MFDQTNTFEIPRISTAILPGLQQKINGKTKPLGALGRLECLALQIGQIQNSLSPQLKQPTMVIFAGDHGAATEGISLYPQEVTQQMVGNFLRGGAAINVFCQQNGLALKIVDAGVNAELLAHEQLIPAKIALGTRNYCREPAMTKEQFEQAIHTGAEIIDALYLQGCNCVGLGEMGIGNTSSASLLSHGLTRLPLRELVGSGTGLDTAAQTHKLACLSQAWAHHNLQNPSAQELLITFGGFEIVMLVGALLQAAQRQMVILVDGFIATAAALAAAKIHSNALAYCVFCHASAEAGHRYLLQHLAVAPLLQLEMRLGEGSGAALAYPLVAAAVNFLNSMASFDDAGVSRASKIRVDATGN